MSEEIKDESTAPSPAERPIPLVERVRRRLGSASAFLAAACALGYVGVGHLLGEVYPFSPLGMFEQVATRSSRLVARTADGNVIEVARFAGFRCSSSLDFSPSAHPECPAVDFSAYDDIVRDYIVAHPDESGEGAPIEIVRRVFTLEDRGAALSVFDCPLVACTATFADRTPWTHRL